MFLVVVIFQDFSIFSSSDLGSGLGPRFNFSEGSSAAGTGDGGTEGSTGGGAQTNGASPGSTGGGAQTNGASPSSTGGEETNDDQSDNLSIGSCACCDQDQDTEGHCICDINCPPQRMNHYPEGAIGTGCRCRTDIYNYGCQDCAGTYCNSCYVIRKY